jgi:metallo-beta-lactamase class B
MLNHPAKPLLLVALLSLLPSAAATQSAAIEYTLSDDLQVLQLTEDIWRFVSTQDMGENWGRVPANGLVVLSDQAAALIDTPWTDEQTRILSRWVEAELGAKIEVVIPTHSHDDCLGGLNAAHALGARSYGHARTAEFARRDGKPAPRTTFQDRLSVPLGKRNLELRYLGPGHTEDNSVVWIPDAKILFGGCLIKSATARTMGYIQEADLAAWPGTLARVRAEYPDAALIVPGHGRPGGAETLDRTLELIADHRGSVAAQSLDAQIDDPDKNIPQRHQTLNEPKGDPVSSKAEGTFEVSMKPESTTEDDGITRGRMRLEKTFTGDLVGTGQGEMLTAMTGTQGSAGYVAIERVTGTLHGRAGSFVLQHTGIMDRGTPQLAVTIVPDSGTGELAGIAGTLAIDVADGQHRYTLEYSLPE